jgi:hypothetical protein
MVGNAGKRPLEARLSLGRGEERRPAHSLTCSADAVARTPEDAMRLVCAEGAARLFHLLSSR